MTKNSGGTGACVIGLDGGGTKIHAVAADGLGRVIGEGRSGACNLAAVPVKECLEAAVDASAQALGQAGVSSLDVVSVCAGLAGVSFTQRADEFRQALRIHFPNASIAVVPDYVTAHYGALAGVPGVIVIGGTGSVAYGENATRISHKSGAYGYLIDDSGSGYGVGRQAIASVMSSADGTGEATALTERVLARLNLSGITEIVPAVYGGKVDRVTIASLAEVVAAAAVEDEDGVAAAILADAGRALAGLTSSVLSSLFSDAEYAIPIVSVGSLWNCGKPLLLPFLDALGLQSIPFEVQGPIEGPASGAVGLALRSIPW